MLIAEEAVGTVGDGCWKLSGGFLMSLGSLDRGDCCGGPDKKSASSRALLKSDVGVAV